MQIFSLVDNLHEMTMPFFWKKKKNEKYFKTFFAENFTQHAEC